jgi:cytochrome c nitrite reductase small subunit
LRWRARARYVNRNRNLLVKQVSNTTIAMVAAAFIGIAAGLGAFAFTYGEGVSYLSTRPEACANCHIMWPQYDSWSASSHKHVAVCSDCHLPHSGLHKWVAKADNGFFHSYAFTFQNFPEPIRIKPRSYRIVQNNCVECHRDMIHEMLPATVAGDAVQCIHCHANVGHAAQRGHFTQLSTPDGVIDEPTRP